MVVNKEKLPKKENPVQVQIKLIRSQARGLWVTSSLAILISLASLAFSYYVYRNENDEFCSVSATIINEDFETKIESMGACCDSFGNATEYHSVLIKYTSETINLSKEPITLVSYYIINEGDIEGHKKDNLDWEKIIKNGNWHKFIEKKLPNPVVLNSGEPYTFKFDTYFDMDNMTYDLIRTQLKDIVFKNDVFHISDIMHLFYKHQKDMFGNDLDCRFDSVGVYSYSILSFDILKKEHPFYFVVRIAKGNYFAKRVTWYNRDNFELPFAYVNNLDKGNN